MLEIICFCLTVLPHSRDVIDFRQLMSAFTNESEVDGGVQGLN